jgi:chromosome partitioning protein
MEENMTVLLVAHTKGGVTKTTTALNLAVMRARKNPERRIMLIDSDTGQSLNMWNIQRDKLGVTPAFPCGQQFGYGVHNEVTKAKAFTDDIIIDAGGEGIAAPEIRLLMGVADKLLTPCRTPAEDTVRLANIYALLTDMLQANPKLDPMLFPVAASTHPNAKDVAEFYKRCAEFPNYRLIDAVLRDRTAYTGWAETGRAVCEAKSPNPAAVAELEQLYAEVFNG